MNGSLSYCSAPSTTAAVSTRPMIAMGTGFMSRNRGSDRSRVHRPVLPAPAECRFPERRYSERLVINGRAPSRRLVLERDVGRVVLVAHLERHAAQVEVEERAVGAHADHLAERRRHV